MADLVETYTPIPTASSGHPTIVPASTIARSDYQAVEPTTNSSNSYNTSNLVQNATATNVTPHSISPIITQPSSQSLIYNGVTAVKPSET